MIEIAHAVIGLVVLVVLVLLAMHVADWIGTKFSPLNPPARGILAIVTVLVFVILLVVLVGFASSWGPEWIKR